jgi:zinc transport system substrate-binding protein
LQGNACEKTTLPCIVWFSKIRVENVFLPTALHWQQMYFRSFLLCLIFSTSLLLGEAPSTAPLVLISVAPYKPFIEKIAGDTVQIQLMVPTGASSHTYEPTPRQMVRASGANLWFVIGEPFEKRAVDALKSHHPALHIINLQTGLDLINSAHHHGCKGCCPGAIDLHFWLSPRQAQIQAQTIAEELIKLFPQNAEQYRKNLSGLQRELQELDQKIEAILTPLKNRNILVSHPAYAYFCRDYHLIQHSIEIEGKDPTPQQMTKMLNLARQIHIKSIFIQPQYNNKAAKLVAETLNAKLVVLDPYSEHYFTSMLEIATAFANG